jgi:hypothetical protein
VGGSEFHGAAVDDTVDVSMANPVNEVPGWCGRD